MKNKLGVFLLAVFAVILAAFSLISIKAAGERSGMVRVQGRVYYDDHGREDIVIYWRRDLVRGAPVPGNRPVVIKRVPGDYSLYVPKDITGFYICARGNIAKGGNKNHSVAYFVSDLVPVGPKKEKIYMDIHLKKRSILMDDYAGRTVRIAGKVIQGNYKGGLIAIAVETPENHEKVFLPPDIAQRFIPQPGSYDINVPAGIGRVYIHALNYPDKDYYGDMPGVFSGSYRHNPLDIGNSGIEGVDIAIE